MNHVMTNLFVHETRVQKLINDLFVHETRLNVMNNLFVHETRVQKLINIFLNTSYHRTKTKRYSCKTEDILNPILCAHKTNF